MDQGRRRQTRRPALLRNDRRGSARSVGVRNSCDHRRARRPPASSNPSGASPPFRRRCHPPPEPERVPTRNDEPSANNARTNRNRSRRAQRGRSTTELRIVEEHSSRRPILWSGLRPRTGGGTPRAIARIEVRAIDSAMWLVRCCCRQRPQGIPTPALVESRSSRSRELVPESSLPVRPSNVAGG